ncbi:unnamed protein product [Darwinula stevensoni]|uniref:Peptidase S1 domain-containing protein n=1 Tax=Darwinula stevensoni TaxID=69355 RepID=A0A7R9A4W9_9CRUS|nr:unnamed protein product [Darwinula stevensoni]CAG0893367.1 unnamed protein product [Darwinula stevensoni]
MPSVMYLFLLFLVSPIESFPTQPPEPCPSGRGECRRMKECPAEVAMFNENPSILPSLLCSMDPSGEPMICCNKTSPLPEVTRENTAMRISKAKCHEYQLMLAETKSTDCEYLQQPLITGGTAAEPFEFPHLAYHDIALLRMDNDVPIRSMIYPACLPTDKEIPPPGTPLVVAGWGRLAFGGKRATVLQKVTVPLNDTLECDLTTRFIFVKKNYPNGMKGQVLCAGIEGKDSCQGDSGGPLMLPRNENSCVHYVLGTVSTGAGCGAAGFPGFYTNVPFYLDWIEETVWKNDP